MDAADFNVKVTATEKSSGKVSDYGKAGKASVALIGTGAKVGVNISKFNKDVIDAYNEKINDTIEDILHKNETKLLYKCLFDLKFKFKNRD